MKQKKKEEGKINIGLKVITIYCKYINIIITGKFTDYSGTKIFNIQNLYNRFL